MREAFTIKGMHVGEQGIMDDEVLTFCRQMGVEYVKASPPVKREVKGLGLEEKGYYNADSLAEWREHVESFGLKLVMMQLMPSPSIVEIGKRRGMSIMLGTPQRDRDIERMCKSIEAVGKAGIPILEWGFGPTSWVRSIGRTTGRGGIKYEYLNWDEIKDAPPHPAGPISTEDAWERIEYVVERVIPVAEEYKVKMACHPNDIPVPLGISYRGVEAVLSNVEGLKRFIDLYPSDYNGLAFCQGCVSEVSTNPEQVYEAIRYFGERKKIFWVDFRNVRGGFLKFEETFPDEGDIDMIKAIRTYKEVGYNGVLAPDHIPHSYLDTSWGHRARTFCYGYIKAAIQAVESEE